MSQKYGKFVEEEDDQPKPRTRIASETEDNTSGILNKPDEEAKVEQFVKVSFRDDVNFNDSRLMPSGYRETFNDVSHNADISNFDLMPQPDSTDETKVIQNIS